MSIRFPAVILILIALFGASIYALHLFHLVTSANEVYARYIALSLFLAGFVFLVWQKLKHHRFSWNDFYKNDSFIVAGITFLLAAHFFPARVSYYAIGILTIAALLHLLHHRKMYAPPKFFYIIIAYGVLMFLGTIGTQKGFRFPDKILCFYVLPLAFSCFFLPQKTLLQIADLFFKAGIIYLSLCVLYWWFNFLHLEDANFLKWIYSGKGLFFAQMTDWERQFEGTFFIDDNNPITKDQILYYAVHCFVNSWAYSYHPTTVSIVLLSGLAVGFYLYEKKDAACVITKWHLLIYAALCLLVIRLIGTRYGLLGYGLVMTVTGLYYLKQKTKYFKWGVLVCLLMAGIGLYVLENRNSTFVNDDIRSKYRRIAVSYIRDHPWWGIGFDQERVALEQQVEKIKDTIPPSDEYLYTNANMTHVHNQFLGEMVQFGIWGLVALLSMLASIAYYAFKKRSYLLLMLLCYWIVFMCIESGLFIKFFSFLIFFTALSEAERNPNKHPIKLFPKKSD